MELKIWVNCALLILCAGSAITDIIKWKIPNIWVFSWMAGGVIFSTLTIGVPGTMDSLLGCAVPVLILGIFFFFRMIGAGDIKLFCAVGAWMGADRVLMCMLWTFIIAALISAGKLILNKDAKKRFAHLGNYIKRVSESGVRTDYDMKNAGKARLHISIPILAAVIIKVIGVY